MHNKKNITDKNCRLTIFRMQKIVFSDHRLIFGFNQACGNDIYKFKCGRVEKNNTEVCVCVCMHAWAHVGAAKYYDWCIAKYFFKFYFQQYLYMQHV